MSKFVQLRFWIHGDKSKKIIRKHVNISAQSRLKLCKHTKREKPLSSKNTLQSDISLKANYWWANQIKSYSPNVTHDNFSVYNFYVL